jgi:hypothetical protein
MINVVELNRELEQTGCSIVREDGFLVLSSITGSTHRLLCASQAALRGNALWPSGFSYWLHEGQGLAFVGLWNGLLYHLPDAQRIIAVCKELCSTRVRPESGPLTMFPRDVAETYKMQEVELLVLADVDAASWEDAMKSDKPFPYSERDFVLRIQGEVDSLHKDSAGSVHLTVGACHAFTKFTETMGDRTTLGVVVQGGLRETDDQVRLLAALERAFALAMFDPGWANRIDLGDPYYASPRNGFRPHHPMGRWTE